MEAPGSPGDARGVRTGDDATNAVDGRNREEASAGGKQGGKAATRRPELTRLQHIRTARFPSHWEPISVHGPWRRWFDPVVVDHTVASHHVVARWTARRHRKGRPLSLRPIPDDTTWGKIVHERPRSLLAPFGYRLWGWEPRRIEYWNALFFTVGSIWWIINAFFVMWPLKNEKASLYVVGYTGFVGGLCFWFGSYAGVLEVVNKDEHVSLGWEVHHDLEKLESVIRRPQKHGNNPTQPPDIGRGRDSHPEKDGGANGEDGKGEMDRGGGDAARRDGKKRFKWWGWEPHNFSYAAAFVQLIGATIFSISANITGLPHVLPINYPPDGWVLWDIFAWTPQCVGALFFIANGLMAMREVQTRWLQLRPLDIGWEVGFWNGIGGIGFFLFGFFGYFRYPVKCCVRWAGEFATFWGSWAFLLSSYLLLVEVLN